MTKLPMRAFTKAALRGAVLLWMKKRNLLDLMSSWNFTAKFPAIGSLVCCNWFYADVVANYNSTVILKFWPIIYIYSYIYIFICLLYLVKYDKTFPFHHIRIKSGEPGFLGFSVPEWLGGVICKPEGAAWGLVKTPPSLRARKIPENTIDRLYFISKMPKMLIN